MPRKRQETVRHPVIDISGANQAQTITSDGRSSNLILGTDVEALGKARRTRSKTRLRRKVLRRSPGLVKGARD
jgi:hypothetical protein